MIALVTGGNGFVGRYIVEQLLARGDHVRVIGRGAYPELQSLGAETYQADLTLPESAPVLARAMRGVTTVFHVAAKAGLWGSYDDFYRANVSATQRVVKAAIRAGVPKLVYTSTPSVVIGHEDIHGGDEHLPYPRRYLAPYPHTKAIAERYVLAQTDIATVSLRPHLIWGPRDPHILPRLLRRARRRMLFQIGDGTNLVDVCYVENAATAHIQAASALNERSPLRGRAYFIGQERPVNLWQFIGEILKAANCPPVRGRISASAATILATGLELLYTILRLPGEPPLTRLMVHELSHSHWFSHAAAERDFGYTPRISIEEGLERTFALTGSQP
ncbi:MAG TPA: 3-beta hydroxysteroid dehydrogenase [Chloroflexus aurantiacus]|jgi:nucleoside-diphosphate-sugar epimerase|uniref:3-beta hydroxysteroid dehydrogenase/isomerase n=1 Tax=Chloroflexus aurantiacus (strain ATCC 29366 / DSM 635 / J-10-fl) TaxID=324602 RepID=A9WA32_CHLAA|nr:MULTISPECIES: NAD-dependent epimerase/dehydratase family protein [Chloroflexus]ABY36714.1 3-beta hydroxysteroid dehydrogenase/isomerase [Chloroflexus aurantiacus J-10-fl]RMG50448.1 MAG: NAD-dependent epimerase/dehydratase family protein [Chloroflexota bacterium]HBW67631.1 3-beta hydroxysteroid dehydrogenase [Chloroflexus aurantiacus]